jgi:hypothetical protein
MEIMLVLDLSRWKKAIRAISFYMVKFCGAGMPKLKKKKKFCLASIRRYIGFISGLENVVSTLEPLAIYIVLTMVHKKLTSFPQTWVFFQTSSHKNSSYYKPKIHHAIKN